MKTILMVMLIVLAAVGALSIVLYAVSHKADVQVEETLPGGVMTSLPRESIKADGAARFTPLAQAESDSLALLKNQSLLGLTAGAFSPRFDTLSSSEQITLKASEEQKPELQDMAAGDMDMNANAGLGGVTVGLALLVALVLLIL